MKAHFRHEIEALDGRLRKLTDHVLAQARRAAELAIAGNPAAAEAVTTEDADVDRQEVRIEEECLKILALYAPVANELRYIFGVTKVNHALERIGDLAKKIARLAVRLPPGGFPAIAQDSARLADLAASATARAIGAFITQDAVEARAVWEGDAGLDALHDRLSAWFEQALSQPAAPVRALLAGRSIVASLERMGDHAAHIAKIVIYMRDGEILRHRPLSPRDPPPA